MTRKEILLMSDEELGKLCEISFFKSSGNGGQKRNKCSTAVRVKLTIDRMSFVAEDCTERSQHRNRAAALQKLRRLIAFEVRIAPALPPPRIECALEHDEYPLNLAHLLDVLEEENFDHKKCAARCGVSATAFIKLLRRDSELWTKVNSARECRGLYKLKIN